MSENITTVDPEAYARYKADLAKKLAGLSAQDRADVKVREEEAREQATSPKAPRQQRSRRQASGKTRRRRRSTSAAPETSSTPAADTGTNTMSGDSATGAPSQPTSIGSGTRGSIRTRRKRPSEPAPETRQPLHDATKLPTVPNTGQSGIPVAAPSNPTPTVVVPDNPELLEAD